MTEPEIRIEPPEVRDVADEGPEDVPLGRHDVEILQVPQQSANGASRSAWARA